MKNSFPRATPPKRTKAKGVSGFLREYARYLLAHRWCPSAAAHEGTVRDIPTAGTPEHLAWKIAIDSAWVTGETGHNPHGFIKADGWTAAINFLKR